MAYRGARDDAVVRALVSHQCELSLLLVLSFTPRGFSPGTPVFPSPQKPTFSNSNSTRNQADKEPLCGCATSKSLFIYLFIYLLFIYLMNHSCLLQLLLKFLRNHILKRRKVMTRTMKKWMTVNLTQLVSFLDTYIGTLM